MNSPPASNPYTRHRFPAEIIGHGGWLYCRFCLSHRDVDALMAEGGVILTYEAVRDWCRTLGQAYAHQLRHRQPRPRDTWHLDAVCLTIHGERDDRWRVVDQDGPILDILVPRRRDRAAAKKCFRTWLRGLTSVPRVVITDQRQSDGAALREILPRVEPRQHRYLNNHVDNSHPLTRPRARRLQGFKSPGHAQRFLTADGLIAQHVRPRRHRLSAPVYRREMRQRFPNLASDDRLSQSRIGDGRRTLLTPFCLVIAARPMNLTMPCRKLRVDRHGAQACQ